MHDNEKRSVAMVYPWLATVVFMNLSCSIVDGTDYHMIPKLLIICIALWITVYEHACNEADISCFVWNWTCHEDVKVSNLLFLIIYSFITIYCILAHNKTYVCSCCKIFITRCHILTRARCESQAAVGSSGLNARWSYGWAVELQFSSLIHDSSVGLSAGIQFAGDLVSETLGSNPVFSRGRQLVSFRLENRLPVWVNIESC